MTLLNEMAETRRLINAELDKLLPIPMTRDARVIEAMRYSAIGTGKALRPFLIMTIGKILNVPRTTLLRIGSAIEMLHTFSLIHDDLPAMDNDVLRRGKPTNHVQFDEATAILAGDGLQAKAFEILAAPETHSNPAVRSDLVLALAQATGEMIGGQVMDLIGEKSPLSLDEIKQMQAMKTGALLHFSCLASAIAAQADEEIKKSLTEYAYVIGLMFQITDDILDVEGTTEAVGKTLGKDQNAHKSTFVSTLGLDKAKEMVQELKKKGEAALAPFGEKANLLRELLTFIIERDK